MQHRPAGLYMHLKSAYMHIDGILKRLPHCASAELVIRLGNISVVPLLRCL